MTLMARAWHYQGKYKEASYFYVGAGKVDSGTSPLIQIGKAQMFLTNKSYKEAVKSLETVLVDHMHKADALKLLGQLYF